jgi:hypothetical protein
MFIVQMFNSVTSFLNFETLELLNVETLIK